PPPAPAGFPSSDGTPDGYAPYGAPEAYPQGDPATTPYPTGAATSADPVQPAGAPPDNPADPGTTIWGTPDASASGDPAPTPTLSGTETDAPADAGQPDGSSANPYASPVGDAPADLEASSYGNLEGFPATDPEGSSVGDPTATTGESDVPAADPGNPPPSASAGEPATDRHGASPGETTDDREGTPHDLPQSVGAVAAMGLPDGASTTPSTPDPAAAEPGGEPVHVAEAAPDDATPWPPAHDAPPMPVDPDGDAASVATAGSDPGAAGGDPPDASSSPPNPGPWPPAADPFAPADDPGRPPL
ncbi:MAG: hypothetical protein ABIS47_11630, partial [Acidimicrobiales bacterium]